MRRSDLAALHHKYTCLAVMRRERETLEARGIMRFEGEALVARSAQGRELARRFPGVLRELDVLPSAELDLRHAALATLLGRGDDPVGDCAAWMHVVAAFHRAWLRSMRLRRWLRAELGGARDMPLGETELARCLAAWQTDALPPPDLRELRAHQRPPQGRLASLVWQAVEESTEVPAAHARRLIFTAHLSGAG